MGVSLFYYSMFTCASDMTLYTDASLLGFGRVFKNQWFYSVWPMNIPSVSGEDLSMAFRELYPIVVAAVL